MQQSPSTPVAEGGDARARRRLSAAIRERWVAWLMLAVGVLAIATWVVSIATPTARWTFVGTPRAADQPGWFELDVTMWDLTCINGRLVLARRGYTSADRASGALQAQWAGEAGPRLRWLGSVSGPRWWSWGTGTITVAGLGYATSPFSGERGGSFAITIPLWLICVLTLPWAVWSLSPWARRRRRLAAGLCPHCGYSRAGLPPAAPCPECGQRP